MSHDMQHTVYVPKVKLGDTGVISTRLGLGMAWWPRYTEFKQVVQVVETAFEVGIRHIDIAPLYGSEEIIGDVLKVTGRPDDLVIATKTCAYWDFDLDIEYYAYSPDAVRRSVERSLNRLGVERFDILYMHDTRSIDLPYLFDGDGALCVLENYRKAGTIGLIGMATKDLDCLAYAVDSDRIQAIQTFHTNTILNRTASETLYPMARRKGIAIMDSAPFAGYILATGPIEGAKYNYFPAKAEVFAAVKRVEALCRRKGVSLQEAALAFALNNPDVSTITVSTSKPERVREWTKALVCPLSGSDFVELMEAAGPSLPLLGALLEERLLANG